MHIYAAAMRIKRQKGNEDLYLFFPYRFSFFEILIFGVDLWANHVIYCKSA